LKPRDGLFALGLERFDLDLERLRRPRSTLVNRMIGSFRARGQLTPVIVTRGEAPLMIDGFKRYRAAFSLGWKTLNAVAIEADVRKAKAMVYLMNRAGGFTMVQEALLIKELVELDGLTQDEAAMLLDRHKSWISRRLAMIRQLLPEVIEALLLERIPGGVGPSLARIPLCNQADFSTAIQTHHLTPHEIQRLTDLFCKAGDPGVRKEMLAAPRQALQEVQKHIQGRVVSWPGRIQLMLRIMALIEKALTEKGPHLPAVTFEHLTGQINRITPILADMLTTLQKEALWDD